MDYEIMWNELKEYLYNDISETKIQRASSVGVDFCYFEHLLKKQCGVLDKMYDLERTIIREE